MNSSIILICSVSAEMETAIIETSNIVPAVKDQYIAESECIRELQMIAINKTMKKDSSHLYYAIRYF